MAPPRLTPDISFGHLLTAGALIVSVIIAWGNLRGDVDQNAYRIGQNEQRTEALEKQAALIPERLARIEAILERIDRRTNGPPGR